jgi:hypothetical protein
MIVVVKRSLSVEVVAAVEGADRGDCCQALEKSHGGWWDPLIRRVEQRSDRTGANEPAGAPPLARSCMYCQPPCSRCINEILGTAA